jgi:McrBC 5-methylcytosine restriction system component
MVGWASEVIDLQEWQTVERDLPPMSERDRRLAEALAEGDGRITIEELRSRTRIRTTSWIGVVRFSGFEIRVVPKYAGGTLGVLQMLAYTRGLSALKRQPAIRSLAVQGAHLIDLIALLLAEEADRLARGGLLADYVTREDTLPMVRGRLLPLEQVTRRPGRVDRLECRFDEFESDIDENRLVAAALEVVGRFCHRDDVRRHVNRARSVFDDACDPAALDPAWLTDDVSYHRRNDHYREAHLYARLILRNLAVRDIYTSGQANSFAFLINMNTLFEEFVTSLVRRRLEPRGFVVRAQARDRSLLVDAVTNRSYQSIRPDILVEHLNAAGERVRLPIDAKYKLYEDAKVSSSDLYQAFVYGYAYGSASAGRAYLLFPSLAPTRTDIRVRSEAGLWSAQISAVGIELTKALAALDVGSEPVVPILDEIIADAQMAVAAA